MADPIKISEQNRALSCDEYDKNLDILRDRANHVGTQSCTTLNDLEECLDNSSVVSTLNTKIVDNQDRIISLEDAVQAGGSIITTVANLETRLLIEITKNTDANQSTQLKLDEVELTTISNSGAIQAQRNYIDQQDNNLETQITNALQTNTNQQVTIDNHTNQLTTINSQILTESSTRANKDTDLQTQLNTESNTRATEDTNIRSTLDQEVAYLDNRIDQKHTDAISAITNVSSTLATETQERLTKDNDLQLQINTLTEALASAIPTGTILVFAGNVIPAGFLYCDGQTVIRITYASLFNIISTRFGSDSSSTFKVPDLREKIVYGSPSSNLNSHAPYSYTNEKTLVEENIPIHNHDYLVPGHTHNLNISHAHGLNIRPHTHTTGNTPDHTHSLFPYRNYAEGNGHNDVGGELTTTLNPNGPNIYPNTGNAGAIPGPTVSTEYVQIYPTNDDPLIQKTDFVFQNDITTYNTNDFNSSTSNVGGTEDIDVRQACININYIIKT